VLTERQCQGIQMFVAHQVSRSDLEALLGFDPHMAPERVLGLLDDATGSRDATQVSCAMVLAHLTGLTAAFVPTLIRLLATAWHYEHEDVAHALQVLKDSRAVDALYAACQARHDYLAYDDSHALARKCTWALADIGTSDALAKLQIIATSSDSLVAGYARKRIDSWEAERHRKGH